MTEHPQTFTEVREFGLSHGDFFRIFPRVWPEVETIDPRHVRLVLGESAIIDIRLSEQHYRRLATLKIPYLHIEFRFFAMTEVQRTEFFGKFERAFQKGGG